MSIEDLSLVERPDDLMGYVPTDLVSGPFGVQVVWRYAGDSDLGQSMYDQTVKLLASSTTDRPAVLTSLDLPRAFCSDPNVVPPSGFIFHVGRCGSTVVSNALRSVDDAVVLAQPDPLSELLMPVASRFWKSEQDKSEATLANRVRGMVAALGRKRLGNERRLYIKFTDWNMLCMAFVRSIWPDVPTLIVYRDPVEVAASYLNGAPTWMLFRQMPPSFLGIDPRQSRTMPLEEYCARIEFSIYRAAAQPRDSNVALLNYRSLNQDTMLSVMDFFGVGGHQIDLEKLGDALSHYAKDARPNRRFSPDSQKKQRDIPSDVRRMVLKHVGKSYETLERLSASMSVPERLAGKAERA